MTYILKITLQQKGCCFNTLLMAVYTGDKGSFWPQLSTTASG